MAFNGEEGKMIDPITAQRWIDNYAKSVGPEVTKSEFFGFHRISQLLGQGKAIGLRIYYAKNDAGENTLVLIAASPEDQNLAKIGGSGVEGFVLEDGLKCPPYCPPR